MAALVKVKKKKRQRDHVLNEYRVLHVMQKLRSIGASLYPCIDLQVHGAESG